ncbi:MAG: S8 family serine peptidase [Saprospiraceae bacterium]|nr:S8 family serine peptidase [Candidatus Brachybacter algidus]
MVLFVRKPEFTAPNGVNTSMNLVVQTLMAMVLNFFGTSAAAPHAAAVAALLINGKNKFYNEVLTPAQVRSILTSTALDMSTPGFDFISGAGFSRADEAMATFAAPTPVITSLIFLQEQLPERLHLL